jgi:hypothetical protein
MREAWLSSTRNAVRIVRLVAEEPDTNCKTRGSCSVTASLSLYYIYMYYTIHKFGPPVCFYEDFARGGPHSAEGVNTNPTEHVKEPRTSHSLCLCSSGFPSQFTMGLLIFHVSLDPLDDAHEPCTNTEILHSRDSTKPRLNQGHYCKTLQHLVLLCTISPIICDPLILYYVYYCTTVL